MCASWIALFDTTRAREVLAETEESTHAMMSDVDRGDVPRWVPNLGADLGAAHALVGNAAQAEAHFAAAERGLATREEVNPFEDHTHLAAAYLRIKDVARAFQGLERGPWSHGSATSLEDYVTLAIELGFVDHALDIATRLRKHTDSWGMRAIGEALRPALRAAGREKELDMLLREENSDDGDGNDDGSDDSDRRPPTADELMLGVLNDAGPAATMAHFEAEREQVAKLRGTARRLAASALMQKEIAAGQLASAYASWRLLSKHHREFEVNELVRALSRAKEIGAVIHVLRQLTKRGDMNGLPTIAREAMQLAAGFGVRHHP